MYTQLCDNSRRFSISVKKLMAMLHDLTVAENWWAHQNIENMTVLDARVLLIY
jgi:hypothetical protein